MKTPSTPRAHERLLDIYKGFVKVVKGRFIFIGRAFKRPSEGLRKAFDWLNEPFQRFLHASRVHHLVELQGVQNRHMVKNILVPVASIACTTDASQNTIEAF